MHILTSIRKSRTAKSIVCFAYFTFLVQPFFSAGLFAGNGPLQPEFQGPAVTENAQLVDPFTGDFSYSVDILGDVGIPITLNYTAGISMEQDASWVGLGWNFNPGSIMRSLRGLPDDFMGDVLKEDVNIRPNITGGVSFAIGPNEFFGIDKDAVAGAAEGPTSGASIGIELHYNTYTGFGAGTFADAKININESLSLGLSAESGNENSFGGVGISPSFNIAKSLGFTDDNYEKKLGLTLSSEFSTSGGMKYFNVGSFYSKTKTVQLARTAKAGGDNADYTDSKSKNASANLISFQKSYTPSIGKEFLNQSYSLKGTLGAEVLFSNVATDISGYYTSSTLKDNHTESPAYGYLYLKNSEDNNIVQDINRENDISVVKNSPTLPISYYAYDLFSVSAPGLGGSFRAYRNDIGYMQDEKMKNNTISADLGAEVAAMETFKGGVNVVGVYGESISKPFLDNNIIAEYTPHKTMYSSINNIENNVHFKFVGDNYLDSDPEFIENLQGNSAIETNMRSSFLVPLVNEKKWISNDHNYYPEEIFGGGSHDEDEFDASHSSRNGRVPNAKSIQYFTHEMVEQFFGGENKYAISPNVKDHHIQRIVVTGEDGTQYVFGLPVYNNEQQEIMFNVGGATAPDTQSDEYLVKYDSDQKSLNNKSGLDHMYQNTTTPAYATSFLLTEVYSPDYVDMQGDGPTDDDQGTYIVYTYGEKEGDGKYHPNMDNFKWRTPMSTEDFYASYIKGQTNRLTDDKASIIYGTKEVWYLKTVETKSHFAEFFILDRADGFTTAGIDGGISNTSDQCQKLLDRIEVYSKFDKIRDAYPPVGEEPATDELSLMDELPLTPVKTINFTYEYFLCKGVPTNPDPAHNGRLTLTKVDYTYYNSNKSKFNYYKFEYNTADFPDGDDADTDPDFEPAYHPLASDKWGTIQPYDPAFPTQVFPYTKQDNRALSDYLAGLWSLRRITLPNGGTIEVDYEADDYAYVQNRKAATAFKVRSCAKGFDEIGDDVIVSNLEEDNAYLYGADVTGENFLVNKYIITFELPEPIEGDMSPTAARNYFKDNYLKDYSGSKHIGDNLYFKFYMGTDNDDDLFVDETPHDIEYRFEYVEGYASVDYNNVGVLKTIDNEETPYTIGYFKLNPAKVYTAAGDFAASAFKPEDYDDGFFGTKDVNPIIKASWQWTMLNAQQNITDDSGPDESLGALDYLFDLVSKLTMVNTLLTMFMNPNQLMADGKYGNEFDPEKSIIRLHEPSGFKIGGGHRVKEIRYYDDWRDMTADENPEKSSIYGIKYVYQNPKNDFSSGVAAYEPMAGGEENPLRYPDTYNHYAGDFAYARYLEHPLGESFYPSASIGYDYVEEIPFGQFETAEETWSEQYTDVGKIVRTFYTAKDYPSITKNTELNPINKKFKPGVFASFFQSTHCDLFAGSQGFVIETNDMHGKPRTEATLSKTGEVISSVEYKYKESAPGVLNNTVNVIDEVGEVTPAEMNVTYDVFTDHRLNTAASLGGGAKLGLDFSLIVPVVEAYPNFVGTKSTTAFSVVTKHVQRSGILSQVIRNTNGSILTSNNLVYDKRTGNPIVVSEQNEFEDTYYVVNIPAHWIYDGMGMANDNWDFKFVSHNNDVTTDDDLFNLSTGQITSATLLNNLVPGDRIGLNVIATGGAPEYINVWVYQQVTDVDDELIYNYYLIDRYGNPINFGTDEDVMQIFGNVLFSGRQNLQNTPVLNAITTINPIVTVDDVSTLQLNTESGIIDASVTEFSDIWRIFCTEGDISSTECNCEEEITSGAQGLSDFLSYLVTENEVTHDGSLRLYALLTDYFTNGFNTEILTAITALEGENLVSCLTGIDDDTWSINIHTTDPESPVCQINIEFETEYSEAELIEIFENETLTFSFEVPETSGETCEDITTFNVEVAWTDAGGPETMSGTCASFSCFPLRHCEEVFTYDDFCMGGIGDNINPYLSGLKGNWRPKMGYKYLTERTPDKDATGIGNEVFEIQNHGIYKDFSSFWQLNEENQWVKHPENWQWTMQSTLFDPMAHVAETKNALDIYSASTYNLNHIATEMVANNAGYWQIAFENYEDNLFLDTYQPSICHARHFELAPETNAEISRKYAHSGLFSMKIEGGGSVKYEQPLTTLYEERMEYPTPPLYIEAKDCMPEFAPGVSDRNMEYLLTFWFRHPSQNTLVITDKLDVSITLDETELIIGEPDIDNEIDGWRRVTCSFIMPDEIEPTDLTNPNLFEVNISNVVIAPGDGEIYIDDIKIMPKAAQANCYVYDFLTQRLMAEMDDNHYATFYEYNEEGTLLRIKKETERGIYTIQEARYNTPNRD